MSAAEVLRSAAVWHTGDAEVSVTSSAVSESSGAEVFRLRRGNGSTSADIAGALRAQFPLAHVSCVMSDLDGCEEVVVVREQGKRLAAIARSQAARRLCILAGASKALVWGAAILWAMSAYVRAQLPVANGA